MSGLVRNVVVAGRDAPLWLAAAVIAKALAPAGVTVEAVELPSALHAADLYPTQPALEALHNLLRIDEAMLLRATGGSFTLGQNFVDMAGDNPAFLHAYGSVGAPIDGRDFFAYWLKARRFGLAVPLEDFSLTASAARHGRLLIPNDETELYGRSDYGYHLPALGYARVLQEIAVREGVTAHRSTTIGTLLDSGTGAIAALVLSDGRQIEGDLFIDATGPAGELIGGALGMGIESWATHFPADRVLSATGPRFGAIPIYAEMRAWRQGWTGLYPSQARTHVVHAYASELCSDTDALAGAAVTAGFALGEPVVRAVTPGRRHVAWERNCIALGAAACSFDPVHGIDLHAVHLGLVQLLACFPSNVDLAPQRTEYNRLAHASSERIRDFQSAHYALARYAGAFWDTARGAAISPELQHSIALFRARGELAPWEEESFAPDSWRALFVGHGLVPESWPPTIDRTAPDAMKAQFRRMLGFVKEQVLRQPPHDEYLARIAAGDHG